MNNTIQVTARRAGVAPLPALKKFCVELLDATLLAMDWTGAGIGVLLCSRDEIRRLNREFRNIDEETDVLSFPANPEVEPGSEEYLGDLAICIPYCFEHAAEHGRKPEEEVALLLVHGLLHLIGRDHDTKAREKAMWAETDRLLAATVHVRRPVIKTT